MPIRKAKIGEDEAIHSAHMRSIREVCVHDHGEEEIKGWGYRECGNRWTQAIQNGLVWVVEHEGQIEGVGNIQIKCEKAYVHSLYLTPAVIGQGYGRALMQILLDVARGAGVQKVELESSLTAYQFYLNAGFVDRGPRTQVVVGGYPVACIPMVYEVAED